MGGGGGGGGQEYDSWHSAMAVYTCSIKKRSQNFFKQGIYLLRVFLEIVLASIGPLFQILAVTNIVYTCIEC